MALRVLLADESTTIKKVMQLALQDFAVEVKSVQSGVDVIEVAKSFEPDIIFADVLLQKKNGYEVCSELKRNVDNQSISKIPVVLMWSSFMDLDERAASSCGADRRLEKPFDVEHLRQIVSELVPKTQSQRLAQFLKFPGSVTAPLATEENQKRESAASAPVPSVAKPQAPQPPPQVRPAQPPSQTPKAKESAQPLKPSPPPPPGPAEKQDQTATNWNMESFEDINSFEANSQISEISNLSIEEGPQNSGPAATDAEQPLQIENLQENEFGAQFSTGAMIDGIQLHQSEDAGAADDEEEFKEIRVSKSTRDKQKTPPRGVNLREENDDLDEPTSIDDRDPWSHQDLKRWKIDVEDGDIESFGATTSDLPPELEALETEDMTEITGGERPSGFLHKRAAPASSLPEDHPLASPTFIDEDVPEETGLSIDTAPEEVENLELENQDPLGLGFELEAKGHSESVNEKTLLTGSVPALSADRLEEIIRGQGRDVIELVVRKMVAEIVPDIASRLIREELNRLLEDTSTSRDRLS